MSKIKVLICGASGFIGRNLFEHFNRLNGDYEIYGTYFKNQPSIPESNMFKYDLRDINQAILATEGMDIVINCAAMTDGSGAVAANPAAYIIDNARINTNLTGAGFKNKVKHFIFLSCTVMYPSSKHPLKESESDLANVHPKYSRFAKLKVSAENLCRIYAGLGNTRYTVVRHTNIYGPYDKFDLIRGHVLSATITKVMKSEGQITVWGKGEESRDFLYISDLIEFINKAIEQQTSNFEIFNVGYGKTHSVNELIQKIISCSGRNPGIIHDLDKPTIETHMNISIEKVKRFLDWQAQINLSEGISRTIEWYKNNPR